MRTTLVWPVVAATGAMFCTCGAIAGGSASMGTNQRYCIASDIAIAVCLRRESEIVSVGCRKTGGYDLVEMIIGDWFGRANATERGRTHCDDRHEHRPARVLRNKRAHVPGPMRRLFLGRLAGHENESLQLRALTSGYKADFPLAGFRRAYRMLRHICAAGRDTFRVEIGRRCKFLSPR